MMDGVPFFKFVCALVFVLGLMLLVAWALKRFGVAGAVAAAAPGKKRLSVIEYLPLDHRRRLALVRCDGQAHLLLLGAAGETVVATHLPLSPGDEHEAKI